MTADLAWASLRREDNEDMRRFVCIPSPAPTHGTTQGGAPARAWERELQAGIRNLHHPLPSSDEALVARDDEGIAGVSWWLYLHKSSNVKLQASAAAFRLRWAGSRLGEELLERTVDQIANAADLSGERTVMVWAHLHAQDESRQKLFGRAGFTHICDTPAGLQQWWLRVDIVD